MRFLKFPSAAAVALTSLAFSVPAWALRVQAPCPDGSAFYNEIYNCGQNSVAVAYGQACASSLMAAAKVQGAALSATMTAMKAGLGSAQSASMGDSAQRLRMGIQQFAAQIATLQASTNTVADYTKSMIDFKDGTSDDSSAECFSNNFHQLQTIVTGLDKQILNSKAALQAARDMLATVNHDSGNLDASSVDATANIPGRSTASSPAVPKGQSYLPSSDISGTPKQK